MTENTDAQIRHIYERWHEAVVGRDLDGLMELYAEDAILETPLILATLTDRTQGLLQGKSEIRSFFAAGLRKLGNELNRWHRTGLFFSNGQQLTWEYPRRTPEGEPGGSGRGHGCRERSDCPSSRLLGMGRLSRACLGHAPTRGMTF